MGLCCSKPHTSDAHFQRSHSSDLSTSSLSSNPRSSSPARPSTSVFQYRTAELPEANVDGICVGLTAEWFTNLHNSPRSRMTALLPGSDGHDSAAERQQRFLDLNRFLRSEGTGSSQANVEAKTTIFREAGLHPSERDKVYRFDEPASFSRIMTKITADGSKYLLSLGFAEGDRHTIATSASNGMTTLFDPNYGEFTVEPGQMDRFFQSLTNRYANPNGLHLSTITAQKMY
ncbi:YopT-type cysteine protease domain-containing protein [Bradyrhizobium sp. CB3481]|uniref:YopT-type cysteine protease domain-containing protein n=1 Tax=Bradyrhizobium sp. CB3481 TaxID=3039158 RepID=UPI0024B17B0B|nr:YopT-type cysteine protease domain-containing protein [Bradyrhizobium sp. CB3481]WFU20621.1 YopT-type cysteine protease domain-containing protein [Bradyrhizobium sp. CB3481]